MSLSSNGNMPSIVTRGSATFKTNPMARKYFVALSLAVMHLSNGTMA